VRKFNGKISVLDPFINDALRTGRVRIDVENPDFKLQPDMYVDIDLTMNMGEGVAVPVPAVLPTGLHNIIFVDKGEGKLEPRYVELGRKYGDFYEVKSGVKEGERVVTSANSRLRAILCHRRRGIWALMNTPLDAIPDLSDVQVIVYTDWEGRSPDLVEDQITYPISTKRSSPRRKVKFVRGESMFGKSFVYVIFEDGTDIYWARSRVIEYLNPCAARCPKA
jgi:hypothetical protein